MSHITRSIIVPYTCAEMFQLVDDIEAYPQFIPWCNSATILSRSPQEVRATLCFARGSIGKCFTTANRMQSDKMIDVRLVDGPFKRLEGYWRFDNLQDQACKISLDMEFEFAGRLVSFAFGPLFNQIANTLVDVFKKRAREVYGEREWLNVKR